MTSPERLAELNEMRKEFEAEATTDARRVEILTRLREFANEEQAESKCTVCKQTGFYAPYDYALIEGHCYSTNGIVEYQRLTMTCEYCFDKPFVDPEDPDAPVVGPQDGPQDGD